MPRTNRQLYTPPITVNNTSYQGQASCEEDSQPAKEKDVDSFSPDERSAGGIKNLKVSESSNPTNYSKEITFNVESGQIPKILYSGVSPDGSVFYGKDGTLDSINNKSDLATDISKERRKDPASGKLKDFYTIKVKKDSKVNFKIDGETIAHNAPAEPAPAPTPTIVPIDVKNLKILKSSDPTIDKEITFNVKSGQIPKILYSGVSPDGSVFYGKDGTLNIKNEQSDSATHILKETKRVPGSVEKRDFYTIKIKKDSKVNFKIDGETIAYNAPAEPVPAPTPIPKPPIVVASPAPTPKPPITPSPKPPLISTTSGPDVLALKDSGDLKYPALHSMFTNNVQTKTSKVTYPDYPPFDLKPTEHIKSLNGNYSKYKYGSEYFAEISRKIAEGKGKISIESASIKAHDIISKNSPHHKSKYRLSTETNHEDIKDFEVFFVVGKGYGTTQKTCFKLDAEVTVDAIKRAYGDKCKHAEILEDPSKADFEKALQARAESARKNGRKLYICYTGHGSTIGTQKGVSITNSEKEGSKEFEYGIGWGVTETEMKNLCNKHLKDVETITIIDACYSGAAVTAIEKEEHKKFFESLA